MIEIGQACGWCFEIRHEWPKGKGIPSQEVRNGNDELSFCDECMAVFGNKAQNKYAKQRLKKIKGKRAPG